MRRLESTSLHDDKVTLFDCAIQDYERSMGIARPHEVSAPQRRAFKAGLLHAIRVASTIYPDDVISQRIVKKLKAQLPDKVKW